MAGSFWISQKTMVWESTRKVVPCRLGAHWGSWKSWGHLQSRPTILWATLWRLCYMQGRRKELHIKYEKLKYQAPKAQVCRLKASSVTGCSPSPGTSQWAQSSPLWWYAVTDPTQSKCSFCFLNVTMFISLELPLCELGHLNLSTFPGGSHSKSLLRVSSSDRGVLDWIDEKTQHSDRWDHDIQLLKRSIAPPNPGFPWDAGLLRSLTFFSHPYNDSTLWGRRWHGRLWRR